MQNKGGVSIVTVSYTHLDVYKRHDLKLVFGASIGAMVAMQLIAMPTFKVHTAVLEGCPLHSNAAFLRMMATRMFLSKHRKAQQHPGLSAQRMTKIYGETLGLIMGLSLIHI